MFSRKERDFLALVARCGNLGTQGREELEAQFPNPVYRRKLLWGIRRKAADAAADLELYAVAAQVESKVLPITRRDAPPVVADPLVQLLRVVRAHLSRGEPRRPPPIGSESDLRTEEGRKR